jgi:hypothetical protein
MYHIDTLKGTPSHILVIHQLGIPGVPRKGAEKRYQIYQRKQLQALATRCQSLGGYLSRCTWERETTISGIVGMFIETPGSHVIASY